MGHFARCMTSILCAAMAMTICTAVVASPPPTANLQGQLVGAHGMTLYTYAPDGTTGVSQCQGPCASAWPPYLADLGARAHGGFGLTGRVDDSEQWNDRGRPLYRYAADTKPGEALGDGVNGVWHLARTH